MNLLKTVIFRVIMIYIHTQMKLFQMIKHKIAKRVFPMQMMKIQVVKKKTVMTGVKLMNAHEGLQIHYYRNQM